MQICREYLVGLLMDNSRKELPTTELVRKLEMAAYYTHCELQPVHKILTLRIAITQFGNNNLWKTCASFCRRCIELGIYNFITSF